MTAGPRIVTSVHVVVPARDEQALLPACLDALEVAVAKLAQARPDIASAVTVVLDGCTDGSEALVRRHTLPRVLIIDARSAGAARRRGLVEVARQTATACWSSTWVAGTDADTVVPPHWVTRQVELAEQGVELVVGTVEPDTADLGPEVLALWRASYSRHEGHGHVHGANLGFTLAAYHRVGGYPDLREHEDIGLVERMKFAGVSWRATGDVHVRTSGRELGRTPGGFAGYLRDLVTAVATPVPATDVET